MLNLVAFTSSLTRFPANRAHTTSTVTRKMPGVRMASQKKLISKIKTAQTSTLPAPRLLRIHRAVAGILHLSAAGEYIDNIVRESEESTARADGTTDLGAIIAMKG